MKLFSILLVAVSLVGISCERHEFDGPDGTSQLHKSHSGGGHHEAAGHDEHATTPAHHDESEEGDVKDGKVLKH